MPSAFCELMSENVNVAPLQLSVAVALPVFAGRVFAVHAMVTFIGQVIAGARISWTLIVWIQVFILPHASVAFHVLVMM